MHDAALDCGCEMTGQRTACHPAQHNAVRAAGIDDRHRRRAVAFREVGQCVGTAWQRPSGDGDGDGNNRSAAVVNQGP